MLNKIFKLNLPILLTLSAATGVVLHDTQIDIATATAFSKLPTLEAVRNNNGSVKFGDYHLHTERQHFSNLKSNVARVTPRIFDDKKYISPKKMSLTTGGYDYFLPI